MKTLSQIWKEVQIGFAASSMFGGPSLPVKQEMQKNGWKFEDKVYIAPSALFPCAAVVSNVYSPEGQLVEPGDDRYKKARRKAAEKILGL